MYQRNCSKLLTFTAAFVVTLCVDSSLAMAADELRTALKPFAQQIAAFLKEKRVPNIAVGQFTGPPELPTTSGDGIRVILTQELSQLAVPKSLSTPPHFS